LSSISTRRVLRGRVELSKAALKRAHSKRFASSRICQNADRANAGGSSAFSQTPLQRLDRFDVAKRLECARFGAAFRPPDQRPPANQLPRTSASSFPRLYLRSSAFICG
jgi:hypothetical protein